MMKRNPLPKNADELLAPGEAVAAVLAENQKQWDIPTEVEAVLRGAGLSPLDSIFQSLGRRRPPFSGRCSSRPLFFHAAECPLTMNQGGPNHAKDKTEHY